MTCVQLQGCEKNHFKKNYFFMSHGLKNSCLASLGGKKAWKTNENQWLSMHFWPQNWFQQMRLFFRNHAFEQSHISLCMLCSRHWWPQKTVPRVAFVVVLSLYFIRIPLNDCDIIKKTITTTTTAKVYTSTYKFTRVIT